MCPRCSKKMFVSITRLAEGKIWVKDKCESCSWQTLEYYTEDQPTREEYIQLLEELVEKPEQLRQWREETNRLLEGLRKSRQ